MSLALTDKSSRIVGGKSCMVLFDVLWKEHDHILQTPIYRTIVESCVQALCMSSFITSSVPCCSIPPLIAFPSSEKGRDDKSKSTRSKTSIISTLFLHLCRIANIVSLPLFVRFADSYSWWELPDLLLIWSNHTNFFAFVHELLYWVSLVEEVFFLSMHMLTNFLRVFLH